MLPITATEDNWTYLKYPDNETPWSFRVAYSGFQIIGLDSRNLRGYRTGIHAPAVIYPGNIPSQLGTDYSKPLTIVMCGAPLFGIEAIEYFQSQTDMEVPILLSNLKIKFRYDNKYDKEAWSFDSEAFHTMQVELAKFEKIVVLSGDVHYGFSAKVDYWNEQTATPQTAVFAQCCSSALHNKNTEGASAGMKMGRLLSKGNESVWTKKTGLTTNYSLVDKTTYEDKPQSYSVYQQIRIKLFLDLTIKPVTPTNLTTFISEGILQEQNRKIINSALIADTNIGLIFFSGNNLHHRLITPMPNEKLPKNQIVATHIIDFQLPNVLDKPVKP